MQHVACHIANRGRQQRHARHEARPADLRKRRSERRARHGQLPHEPQPLPRISPPKTNCQRRHARAPPARSARRARRAHARPGRARHPHRHARHDIHEQVAEELILTGQRAAARLHLAQATIGDDELGGFVDGVVRVQALERRDRGNERVVVAHDVGSRRVAVDAVARVDAVGRGVAAVRNLGRRPSIGRRGDDAARCVDRRRQATVARRRSQRHILGGGRRE